MAGGARSLEDGRRVPALHPGDAGDGVSGLSFTGAVDVRGAVRDRSATTSAGRRGGGSARDFPEEQSGQGRTDPVHIPDGARGDSVAAARFGSAVFYARPTGIEPAGRTGSARRAADPA